MTITDDPKMIILRPSSSPSRRGYRGESLQQATTITSTLTATGIVRTRTNRKSTITSIHALLNLYKYFVVMLVFSSAFSPIVQYHRRNHYRQQQQRQQRQQRKLSSNTNTNTNTNTNSNNCIVVVVGKIILDEYGSPTETEIETALGEGGEKKTMKKNERQENVTLSIGGGGPQAAFGAAAALAVWNCYYKSNNSTQSIRQQAILSKKSSSSSHSPPAQPVVFVGPVGNDWTDDDTISLQETVLNNVNHNSRMMKYDPILLQPPPSLFPLDSTTTTTNDTDNGDNTNADDDTNDRSSNNNYYYTPRIRLWHDTNQNVRWYAKNDSFGKYGADGLWKNRPSVNDLASIVENVIITTNNKNKYSINNSSSSSSDVDGRDVSDTTCILHLIAEASTQAAGNGDDWKFLLSSSSSSTTITAIDDNNNNNNNNNNNTIRTTFDYIGLEPVANMNNQLLSYEDAEFAIGILNNTDCNKNNNNNKTSNIVDFFCPDRELDDAIQKYNLYNRIHIDDDDNDTVLVATRDGPRGSTIRNLARNAAVVAAAAAAAVTATSTVTTTATIGRSSDNDNNYIPLQVPAATLRTSNKKPINPTGAGNAYAAAMTALLGIASSSSSKTLDCNNNNNIRILPTVEDAAAIATGVGAIVCEYEGLPLNWDWDVLDRVYEASLEVQSKMNKKRREIAK